MVRAVKVRRLTVGAGIALGLTGGLALALGGALGSPPDPGDPAGRGWWEPAPAAALTPFDDCDQLLDWYVERTLPRVGPYGLDGGAPFFGLPSVEAQAAGSADAEAQASSGDVMAMPAPAARADEAAEAQSSSRTGTNVQELGVDEPDLAKTDGRLLVRVRGGELEVLDVTGSEPRELAELELPAQLADAELLLAGDRVLLTSTGPTAVPVPVPPVMIDPAPPLPDPRELPPPIDPWGDEPGTVEPGFASDSVVPSYPAPAPEQSRLLTVSLADPSDPEVVSDQVFGGSLVAARQYDGADRTVVRLALETGDPALDWVQPHRNRTSAEAKEANKQLVREATIEDWLPTVGDAGSSERTPLLDCEDVSHPVDSDRTRTLTVVTLEADEPEDLSSVAVTAGGGETLYSSADRMYLTTPGEQGRTTEVHGFALDGEGTRYVASGEVRGTLRDRWSMDEHDGVLRVAVAHGADWSPEDNGVTTLREEGGELVEVGTVRGLGPREEIKSVRWFDDLAVVVTFRQTDPLYTVDLSDPARPTALGELKIPGFSRYLHPVGDDRLVGIGQDASLQGVERGAQAALFDIADLTDPTRLDTVSLGALTRAAAEEDPRAFTWLPATPGTGTALTTVTGPSGGAQLVALAADGNGDLDEVETWPLPAWEAGTSRTLPLPDGRVALVSNDVEIIDVPR